MLNDDKEPKNTESASSGDEDQSIGWLEVLAEKPGAIWDQSAPPSPQEREDLQSRPDQDSDQASDGAQDETVNGPIKGEPGQIQGGTASGARDSVQDDPIQAGQSSDSGAEPISGWSVDLQEAQDLGDEIALENDDLIWLDETDTVPPMNSDSLDSDEEMLTGPPSGPTDEAHQGQDANESAEGEVAPVESEEVPEDPDEAVAWLERLAARQGAPSEELPSLQPADSPDAELAMPETIEFDLPYEEAGQIPEDPDEAMAWLERLAARQGVDAEELTTTQADEPVAEPPPSSVSEDTAATDTAGSPPIADLDEALDWLEEITVQQQPDEVLEADAAATPPGEEPPTPAIAHDVEEAMAGAELLFTEPDSSLSADVAAEAVDESQLEDGDDAMAWLEQLAARQGAPIEELSTSEEEGIAGQVQPKTVEASAVETGEQLDALDSTKVPELEETQADVAESAEAMATDEAVDLTAVEASAESVAEAEDAAEEDVPSEDLAWLDTLGDVDAESWLEAEADAEKEETALAPVDTPVLESLETQEEQIGEPKVLATILPEVHGAEELVQAREAMQQGEVEAGLVVYSALVEKGDSLPFLIDDLEIFCEERGPEPSLQRVLGDAYARNGQLQKALRVYREALDNL